MKTKFMMMMAAAAMVLTSCSNDDETDNWNGEIRLSSGIEVQTRTTHNLDGYLKNGETVHVWVDDAKDLQTSVTNENLYQNNSLAVGNNGTLSGGTTMYFPQTGNKVNIYALHTNAALTDNNFPGELTHTVATDQKSSNTPAGGGYQGSDLVFTKVTSVGRTSETVNLPFTHLLSKIEVVLVQGLGSPTIQKVEIVNTQLEAKFTPSKTNKFNVAATGDIAANPIEIDNGITTAENAAKKDTEDGKILNEAIIVPQTLAKDTEFIRITTTAGGVLTYKLPEEKAFAPKTKYRYTITANLSGLTVSSSISTWTEGTGDPNGSATMGN